MCVCVGGGGGGGVSSHFHSVLQAVKLDDKGEGNDSRSITVKQVGLRQSKNLVTALSYLAYRVRQIPISTYMYRNLGKVRH